MNTFLVYFGLALLVYWNLFHKQENTLKLANLIFWICGVLSVLCFRIGVDTGSYIWFFKAIVRGEYETRNMGYVTLIRLSQMISPGFASSVLLVNIVVCGILFFTIWKYSKNKLFSFLLFSRLG